MEKIILALDAEHVTAAAIDFSCYLARVTNSRLTGVFLEGILPEYTNANIKVFRQCCEERGAEAHIHRDRGIPLDELVEESRFADLLVVDPETSFEKRKAGASGKFVKDVLQEAECPVILAPYSFHSVDEIVFAYNGSASSVFAIKQFTYLFPQWRDKQVTIIDVKEENDNAIEHQYKMKEWLKAHYTNVELKVLTGDPSDQLFGQLIDKKNAIVVIGAYGRSMLSNFFQRSHAHLIVKTVNLPIFITHH